MKKIKRSYPHIFFYLNSIFVFVIVAVSSLFKVFLLIFKQEMAMANKFGEKIDVLPLTGSPTLSVDLTLLIILLAIVSAFIFIMKLTKLDSTKLFKQMKDKKKIRKYKMPVLLKVSIITTLVLTILSLILVFIRDQYALYVNDENTKLTSPIYFEDSERYPGSIEEVIIQATPITDHDTVALIRLSFDNATILEVTPLEELTIGTCIEGRLFTAHSICVDVSKLEYIKQGDPLLKVKIQWGEEGGSNVTADIGNGYFDGTIINNDEIYLAVDIGGILPLTGEEIEDNSIPVFILLVFGLVLILVVLIVVTKGHPVFRRIPVYYSIFLIMGLGISTIYIANRIEQESQVPLESKAWATINDNEVCKNNFDYNIAPEGTTFYFSNNIPEYLITDYNYWYVFSPLENNPLYFDMMYYWSTFWEEKIQIYYKATIDNGKFLAPSFDVRTYGDYASAYEQSTDEVSYTVMPTHFEFIDDYKELWITLFDGDNGINYFGVNNNFLIRFKATGGDEANIFGTFIFKKEGEIIGSYDIEEINSLMEYISGNPCQSFSVPYLESDGDGPIEPVSGGDPVGEVTSSVPTGIGSGDDASFRFKIDRSIDWIEYLCDGTDESNPCLENYSNVQARIKVTNGKITDANYKDGEIFVDIPANTMLNPNNYAVNGTENLLIRLHYGLWDNEMEVIIEAGANSSPLTVDADLIMAKDGFNISFDTLPDPPDIIINDLFPLLSIPVSAVEPTDPPVEPTAEPVEPTDEPVEPTDEPVEPTDEPVTTVAPTLITYGDAMQCGSPGCTKDSDCATGLPEYECDESSTDWPNNNKCVKVCPDGETRIDDCTCSGSGGLYQCGPIDVDGNGLLNYKDLSAFARMYNKKCSDSPYQGGGCGGKDINNDGEINFVDLSSFARRYYPKTLTCNL